MSKQISKLMLFFSNFSEASKPCTAFIEKHKLPVILIPLDTVEEREIAKAGEIVSIKGVPTLVVIYTNNEKEIIEKNKEIIGWLQNIMVRIQQQQQHNQELLRNQQIQHERQNIKFAKTPVTQQTSNTFIQKRKEESYEDVELSQKKKKMKVKKPKRTKGDDGVELIFSEQPIPEKNKYNPFKTNGKEGSKSQNVDLMNIAKKMQLEREQALGHWDNRPNKDDF